MPEWTDEEFDQWIASVEDDADVREAWRKESESATAEAER